MRLSNTNEDISDRFYGFGQDSLGQAAVREVAIALPGSGYGDRRKGREVRVGDLLRAWGGVLQVPGKRGVGRDREDGRQLHPQLRRGDSLFLQQHRVHEEEREGDLAEYLDRCI